MTIIYSNLPIQTSEVATDFFEQYFDLNKTVSENELYAIIGYFESKALNTEAAKALSIAVIQGAIDQNLQPMEVLDQFKKLPKQQLDTYLAYFLNLTRYPSSLIGLSSKQSSNIYVQRSILP